MVFVTMCSTLYSTFVIPKEPVRSTKEIYAGASKDNPSVVARRGADGFLRNDKRSVRHRSDGVLRNDKCSVHRSVHRKADRFLRNDKFYTNNYYKPNAAT